MSTHITKDERIQLETLKKEGCSFRYIAKELGKNVSNISREISRNKDPVTANYHYSLANKMAQSRRKQANSSRVKIKIGSELEAYILAKMEENWSPEQIAGRLKSEVKSLKLPTPAPQTIYDFIYLNKPDYKKYLRCKKGKYRRKRGTKIREKEREEGKKKRIDTRPEVIETRERLGDWEGDTIVGGEKTIHILTHVDRKSGYLFADKAEDISKEGIQILTLNSFQKLPADRIKSITYDNGVQFNKHEDTEVKLIKQTKNDDFNIYFAYPYHSWERGTNENTNGLLREYFPKKSLFKNITQAELDKKVKLINDRPRKRLKYLTPAEVFNEGKVSS